MDSRNKGTPTLTPEQESWLNRCSAWGRWSINPRTGLVDVEGSFHCRGQGLRNFMGVRFGRVRDKFICSENQLQSLEGSPREVGLTFGCSRNELRSLEGAPEVVEGSFYCAENRLEDLHGSPRIVGGGFSCSRNRLRTLEGAPERVEGTFDCRDNILTSLEGCPNDILGDLDFSGNPLRSLRGLPQMVHGTIEGGRTWDLFMGYLFMDLDMDLGVRSRVDWKLMDKIRQELVF